jgi:competence protein ComEC
MCSVFDTGAKFANDSDIGKTVLLPFLRYRDIDKLDRFIISHGDNDHIGGANSLIQNLPPDKLITSVPKQLADYSPIRCQAGQSWDWDQVTFTLLSPPSTLFHSENNNSCVLKIQSKQGNMLLTGDIEAEADNWLVTYYGDKLKANILVAPHHGNQTSSSAGFLATVRPDYILIPAVYKNQFGHPHEDVLQRYKNANTKWFNTAETGAIMIVPKDNAWHIETFRENESRYWNFK